MYFIYSKQHFIHCCCYDRGDLNPVNQDAVLFRSVMTMKGPVALLMVCDGVGGLQKGEYASRFVSERVSAWFDEFGIFLAIKGNKRKIANSFISEMEFIHKELSLYGYERGIELATTVSVALLFQYSYFIYHVGDCQSMRAGRALTILSKIQRNLRGELLQAVGFGPLPNPHIQFGKYRKNDAFILCSDGFMNQFTKEEIKELFCNYQGNLLCVRKRLETAVKCVRNRGEKDNVSVLYVRRVQ